MGSAKKRVHALSVTGRDAGSHGTTNLANPCLNTRVEAYLLTGKLDSRNVTCAPHATPKP